VNPKNGPMIQPRMRWWSHLKLLYLIALSSFDVKYASDGSGPKETATNLVGLCLAHPE
jgi:hypothetical protein